MRPSLDMFSTVASEASHQTDKACKNLTQSQQVLALKDPSRPEVIRPTESATRNL